MGRSPRKSSPQQLDQRLTQVARQLDELADLVDAVLAQHVAPAGATSSNDALSSRRGRRIAPNVQ